METIQHLDPHGEGVVKFLDFLPIVAKRLQMKETLEQLLVRAARLLDSIRILSHATVHPIPSLVDYFRQKQAALPISTS